MSLGFRSSSIISTMRRPHAVAMRAWPESAAGIAEAPGKVRPSVSASDIMVAAVPITMQVPKLRAMPASMARHSWLGEAARLFLRPVFPDVAARPQHPAVIIAAEHRPGRHEDRRQVHADRAHQRARRGLVAAAHQHDAVDRVRAQQLLDLHGEEVAVEHGRRLDEVLRERQRRELDRESAGLPDAALHLLRPGAEMGVAGVDVGPGVDDRDDRLPHEVRIVVAHLQRARAMPEGAEILRAVPAGGAKGLPGHFAFLRRRRCYAALDIRQRLTPPSLAWRSISASSSGLKVVFRHRADRVDRSARRGSHRSAPR